MKQTRTNIPCEDVWWAIFLAGFDFIFPVFVEDADVAEFSGVPHPVFTEKSVDAASEMMDDILLVFTRKTHPANPDKATSEKPAEPEKDLGKVTSTENPKKDLEKNGEDSGGDGEGGREGRGDEGAAEPKRKRRRAGGESTKIGNKKTKKDWITHSADILGTRPPPEQWIQFSCGKCGRLLRSSSSTGSCSITAGSLRACCQSAGAYCGGLGQRSAPTMGRRSRRLQTC